MTKRFLIVLAAMGIHGRLSAEQKNDALHAALQAAPGAAATAVSRSAGWGLADLVTVLTALFIALQVAYLIWKWRRDDRRERERIEDRASGRRAEICETEPAEL